MRPKQLIARGLVALGVIACCTGCDSASPDEGLRPLAAGVWGSDEARLEIDEQGGVITFFCAEGLIPDGILLNDRDAFETEGTMVSGPVARAPRPVRYEGLVDGTEMELSITYSDSSTVFGAFMLEKGRDSEVAYICRC